MRCAVQLIHGIAAGSGWDLFILDSFSAELPRNLIVPGSGSYSHPKSTVISAIAGQETDWRVKKKTLVRGSEINFEI
jgi:hypothetical protein